MNIYWTINIFIWYRYRFINLLEQVIYKIYFTKFLIKRIYIKNIHDELFIICIVLFNRYFINLDKTIIQYCITVIEQRFSIYQLKFAYMSISKFKLPFFSLLIHGVHWIKTRRWKLSNVRWQNNWNITWNGLREFGGSYAFVNNLQSIAAWWLRVPVK